MTLRTCPVCSEEGVSLMARFCLPLRDRFRCSACLCSLRPAGRGVLREFVRGGPELVIWSSVIIAIVVQSAWVFGVGLAIVGALELRTPLELDEEDAPSVRRAGRLYPPRRDDG